MMMERKRSGEQDILRCTNVRANAGECTPPLRFSVTENYYDWRRAQMMYLADGNHTLSTIALGHSPYFAESSSTPNPFAYPHSLSLAFTPICLIQHIKTPLYILQIQSVEHKRVRRSALPSLEQLFVCLYGGSSYGTVLCIFLAV